MTTPKISKYIIRHFCQRAAERGIASVDPKSLFDNLHLALTKADDAVAEKVMDLSEIVAIWRFTLPVEGVCYIMARGLVPVTVLTSEHVRHYKAARKMYGRGKCYLWRRAAEQEANEKADREGAVRRRKYK